MSEYLPQSLFTTVSEVTDIGSYSWRDRENVLVDDDDYTWTEGTVSDYRYSRNLQLFDPLFPAYPPDEVPVWFEVTIRGSGNGSADVANNDLYVRMAAGGDLIRVGSYDGSGIVIIERGGFLDYWGITQQQANDIMSGVEPVNLIFGSQGGDSGCRIRSVKLSALVQQPQTEVLSPPVVF